MRISDWSSDVCSSDLAAHRRLAVRGEDQAGRALDPRRGLYDRHSLRRQRHDVRLPVLRDLAGDRSEEHTSELQSLMRISYAVFCLKKKKHNTSKALT